MKESVNGVKVSVVVPVYNTPPLYLRQCLDSLLGQTLKEVEFLCVDDLSTDDSLEIVQEYAQQDSRIVVVESEENAGVAVARNIGVTYATGRYLYFMDCDDILSEEALETLYTVAEQRAVDVLLFGGAVFYEEQGQVFLGDKKEYTYPEAFSSVMTGPTLFTKRIENECEYGYIWLQFIRLDSFLERNLRFSSAAHTCDDEVFTFHNLNTAQKVSCISNQFYQYRIRDNSGISKPRTNAYFQGTLQWYYQTLSAVPQLNIPQESIPSFKKYFQYARSYVAYNYWLVTGESPVEVEETLLNMEHLLFNEPLEPLKRDDFVSRRQELSPLCFFGAGTEGRRCLRLFKDKGYTLPLVICDNNQALHGTEMEGVLVLPFEKAVEQYPDMYVLITNQRYFKAIHAQVRERIPEEHIVSLPGSPLMRA